MWSHFIPRVCFQNNRKRSSDSRRPARRRVSLKLASGCSVSQTTRHSLVGNPRKSAPLRRALTIHVTKVVLPASLTFPSSSVRHPCATHGDTIQGTSSGAFLANSAAVRKGSFFPPEPCLPEAAESITPPGCSGFLSSGTALDSELMPPPGHSERSER